MRGERTSRDFDLFEITHYVKASAKARRFLKRLIRQEARRAGKRLIRDSEAA